MNESKKIQGTKWYPYFLEISKNKSILDIGCGNAPVFLHAIPFDFEQGDANKILNYVKQDFDIVFSSHCFEYMLDTVQSIQDWFLLVKKRIFDNYYSPKILYEQRYLLKLP